MVASFRARVGRVRSVGSGARSGSERDAREALKPIIAELNRWIEHMEHQNPEVLKQALRPTFEKSQVYVPQDSGELKASGYLVAKKLKHRTLVEIGYSANGRAPYGVYVHEKVEYRHDHPTRAKFLQGALEEDAESIPTRIRQLIKQASGT